MERLNRRQFVLAATAAACACAAGSESAKAAPQARSQQKIDVGTLADYPASGVSDKFIKPGRILVVRNGDRIYACSAVCTHKSCLVKVKDNQIKCPCHGSAFSDQGTVTDGPAKSSLVRYAIDLDDKQHLIVDKKRSFAERQWENPASYLKITG